MSNQANRQWYRAKFTPVASILFPQSFYTDGGEVFCTIAELSANNRRVVVATAKKESNIRILTEHMAHHCLVEIEELPSTESAELTDVAAKIIEKVS